MAKNYQDIYSGGLRSARTEALDKAENVERESGLDDFDLMLIKTKRNDLQQSIQDKLKDIQDKQEQARNNASNDINNILSDLNEKAGYNDGYKSDQDSDHQFEKNSTVNQILAQAADKIIKATGATRGQRASLLKTGMEDAYNSEVRRSFMDKATKAKSVLLQNKELSNQLDVFNNPSTTDDDKKNALNFISNQNQDSVKDVIQAKADLNSIKSGIDTAYDNAFGNGKINSISSNLATNTVLKNDNANFNVINTNNDLSDTSDNYNENKANYTNNVLSYIDNKSQLDAEQNWIDNNKNRITDERYNAIKDAYSDPNFNNLDKYGSTLSNNSAITDALGELAVKMGKDNIISDAIINGLNFNFKKNTTINPNAGYGAPVNDSRNDILSPTYSEIGELNDYQNKIDDAKRYEQAQNSGKVNGLFGGLVDKTSAGPISFFKSLTNLSTWDPGYRSIESLDGTEAIIDKVKSGKQLSQNEQNYLNTVNHINNETDLLKKSGIDDPYYYWEQTASTMPFVIQTMLTSGVGDITASLGKSITGAAQNMFKSSVKATIKKAAEAGVEGATDAAERLYTIKDLSSIGKAAYFAGKGLEYAGTAIGGKISAIDDATGAVTEKTLYEATKDAIYENGKSTIARKLLAKSAGAAVQTAHATLNGVFGAETFGKGMYDDTYLSNYTGQIKWDPKAHRYISVGGTDKDNAKDKSLIDTSIQMGSEMMGTIFEGGLTKLIMPGIDKVMAKLSTTNKGGVMAKTIADGINWLAKSNNSLAKYTRGNIVGLPGEYSEEVIGNVAESAFGLMDWYNQDSTGTFNLDQNLKTLYSLGAGMLGQSLITGSLSGTVGHMSKTLDLHRLTDSYKQKYIDTYISDYKDANGDKIVDDNGNIIKGKESEYENVKNRAQQQFNNVYNNTNFKNVDFTDKSLHDENSISSKQGQNNQNNQQSTPNMGTDIFDTFSKELTKRMNSTDPNEHLTTKQAAALANFAMVYRFSKLNDSNLANAIISQLTGKSSTTIRDMHEIGMNINRNANDDGYDVLMSDGKTDSGIKLNDDGTFKDKESFYKYVQLRSKINGTDFTGKTRFSSLQNTALLYSYLGESGRLDDVFDKISNPSVMNNTLKSKVLNLLDSGQQKLGLNIINNDNQYNSNSMFSEENMDYKTLFGRYKFNSEDISREKQFAKMCYLYSKTKFTKTYSNLFKALDVDDNDESHKNIIFASIAASMKDSYKNQDLQEELRKNASKLLFDKDNKLNADIYDAITDNMSSKDLTEFNKLLKTNGFKNKLSSIFLNSLVSSLSINNNQSQSGTINGKLDLLKSKIINSINENNKNDKSINKAIFDGLKLYLSKNNLMSKDGNNELSKAVLSLFTESYLRDNGGKVVDLDLSDLLDMGIVPDSFLYGFTNDSKFGGAKLSNLLKTMNDFSSISDEDEESINNEFLKNYSDENKHKSFDEKADNVIKKALAAISKVDENGNADKTSELYKNAYEIIKAYSEDFIDNYKIESTKSKTKEGKDITNYSVKNKIKFNKKDLRTFKDKMYKLAIFNPKDYSPAENDEYIEIPDYSEQILPTEKEDALTKTMNFSSNVSWVVAAKNKLVQKLNEEITNKCNDLSNKVIELHYGKDTLSISSNVNVNLDNAKYEEFEDENGNKYAKITNVSIDYNQNSNFSANGYSADINCPINESCSSKNVTLLISLAKDEKDPNSVVYNGIISEDMPKESQIVTYTINKMTIPMHVGDNIHDSIINAIEKDLNSKNKSLTENDRNRISSILKNCYYIDDAEKVVSFDIIGIPLSAVNIHYAINTQNLLSGNMDYINRDFTVTENTDKSISDMFLNKKTYNFGNDSLIRMQYEHNDQLSFRFSYIYEGGGLCTVINVSDINNNKKTFILSTPISYNYIKLISSELNSLSTFKEDLEDLLGKKPAVETKNTEEEDTDNAYEELPESIDYNNSINSSIRDFLEKNGNTKILFTDYQNLSDKQSDNDFMLAFKTILLNSLKSIFNKYNYDPETVSDKLIQILTTNGDSKMSNGFLGTLCSAILDPSNGVFDYSGTTTGKMLSNVLNGLKIGKYQFYKFTLASAYLSILKDKNSDDKQWSEIINLFDKKIRKILKDNGNEDATLDNIIGTIVPTLAKFDIKNPASNSNKYIDSDLSIDADGKFATSLLVVPGTVKDVLNNISKKNSKKLYYSLEYKGKKYSGNLNNGKDKVELLSLLQKLLNDKNITFNSPIINDLKINVEYFGKLSKKNLKEIKITTIGSLMNFKDIGKNYTQQDIDKFIEERRRLIKSLYDALCDKNNSLYNIHPSSIKSFYSIMMNDKKAGEKNRTLSEINKDGIKITNDGNDVFNVKSDVDKNGNPVDSILPCDGVNTNISFKKIQGGSLSSSCLVYPIEDPSGKERPIAFDGVKLSDIMNGNDKEKFDTVKAIINFLSDNITNNVSDSVIFDGNKVLSLSKLNKSDFLKLFFRIKNTSQVDIDSAIEALIRDGNDGSMVVTGSSICFYDRDGNINTISIRDMNNEIIDKFLDSIRLNLSYDAVKLKMSNCVSGDVKEDLIIPGFNLNIKDLLSSDDSINKYLLKNGFIRTGFKGFFDTPLTYMKGVSIDQNVSDKHINDETNPETKETKEQNHDTEKESDKSESVPAEDNGDEFNPVVNISANLNDALVAASNEYSNNNSNTPINNGDKSFGVTSFISGGNFDNSGASIHTRFGTLVDSLLRLAISGNFSNQINSITLNDVNDVSGLNRKLYNVDVIDKAIKDGVAYDLKVVDFLSKDLLYDENGVIRTKNEIADYINDILSRLRSFDNNTITSEIISLLLNDCNFDENTKMVALMSNTLQAHDNLMKSVNECTNKILSGLEKEFPGHKNPKFILYNPARTNESVSTFDVPRGPAIVTPAYKTDADGNITDGSFRKIRGELDAIAQFDDGSVIVIDFKTSTDINSIKEKCKDGGEYQKQLSVYGIGLRNRCNGLNVLGGIILPIIKNVNSVNTTGIAGSSNSFISNVSSLNEGYVKANLSDSVTIDMNNSDNSDEKNNYTVKINDQKETNTKKEETKPKSDVSDKKNNGKSTLDQFRNDANSNNADDISSNSYTPNDIDEFRVGRNVNGNSNLSIGKYSSNNSIEIDDLLKYLKDVNNENYLFVLAIKNALLKVGVNSISFDYLGTNNKGYTKTSIKNGKVSCNISVSLSQHSNDKDLCDTIIHEIIHACTASEQYYPELSKGLTLIRKVFNSLDNDGFFASNEARESGISYVITSVREAIAESASEDSLKKLIDSYLNNKLKCNNKVLNVFLRGFYHSIKSIAHLLHLDDITAGVLKKIALKKIIKYVNRLDLYSKDHIAENTLKSHSEITENRKDFNLNTNTLDFIKNNIEINSRFVHDDNTNISSLAVASIFGKSNECIKDFIESYNNKDENTKRRMATNIVAKILYSDIERSSDGNINMKEIPSDLIYIINEIKNSDRKEDLTSLKNKFVENSIVSDAIDNVQSILNNRDENGLKSMSIIDNSELYDKKIANKFVGVMLDGETDSRIGDYMIKNCDNKNKLSLRFRHIQSSIEYNSIIEGLAKSIIHEKYNNNALFKLNAFLYDDLFNFVNNRIKLLQELAVDSASYGYDNSEYSLDRAIEIETLLDLISNSNVNTTYKDCFSFINSMKTGLSSVEDDNLIEYGDDNDFTKFMNDDGDFSALDGLSNRAKYALSMIEMLDDQDIDYPLLIDPKSSLNKYYNSKDVFLSLSSICHSCYTYEDYAVNIIKYMCSNPSDTMIKTLYCNMFSPEVDELFNSIFSKYTLDSIKKIRKTLSSINSSNIGIGNIISLLNGTTTANLKAINGIYDSRGDSISKEGRGEVISSKKAISSQKLLSNLNIEPDSTPIQVKKALDKFINDKELNDLIETYTKKLNSYETLDINDANNIIKILNKLGIDDLTTEDVLDLVSDRAGLSLSSSINALYYHVLYVLGIASYSDSNKSESMNPKMSKLLRADEDNFVFMFNKNQSDDIISSVNIENIYGGNYLPKLIDPNVNVSINRLKPLYGMYRECNWMFNTIASLHEQKVVPHAINSDGNLIQLCYSANGFITTLDKIQTELKNGENNNNEGERPLLDKMKNSTSASIIASNGDSPTCISEVLNNPNMYEIERSNRVDSKGKTGNKTSKDFNGLTNADDTIDRMNKLLSGIIVFPTVASSKTQYQIVCKDQEFRERFIASMFTNFDAFSSNCPFSRMGLINIARYHLMSIQRAKIAALKFKDIAYKYINGTATDADWNKVINGYHYTIKDGKIYPGRALSDLGIFRNMYILDIKSPTGGTIEVNNDTESKKPNDVVDFCKECSYNDIEDDLHKDMNYFDDKDNSNNLQTYFSNLEKLENNVSAILNGLNNSKPEYGTGSKKYVSISKMYHMLFYRIGENTFNGLLKNSLITESADEVTGETKYNIDEDLRRVFTIPFCYLDGDIYQDNIHKNTFPLSSVDSFTVRALKTRLACMEFLWYMSRFEFNALYGTNDSDYKNGTDRIKRIMPYASIGTSPVVINDASNVIDLSDDYNNILDRINNSRLSSEDKSTAKKELSEEKNKVEKLYKNALEKKSFKYASMSSIVSEEHFDEETINNIKDMFRKNISELYDIKNYNDAPEGLKKIIDRETERRIAYLTNKGGIDSCDGASFVTPEFYITYLIKEGRQVPQIFNTFYDNYISKGIELNREQLNRLTPYFLNPMKLVYSAQDYDKVDNSNMYEIHHHTLKMAVFPLLPSICREGTTGGKMLEIMRKNGIDMIGDEGIEKVGTRIKYNVFNSNEDGTVNTGNDNILGRDLDIQMLRRQMETNPHESSERDFGTQLISIALANLSNKASIGDKSAYGLSTDCFDCMSNIAKCGSMLSLLKFGDINQKTGNFIISKDKIVKFFLNEAKSKNLPHDIVEAIKNMDSNEVKIPISMIISPQLFESTVLSSIKKNISAINSAGGSFIQVPQTILRRIDSLGDKKLINNGNKLKLYNNKGCMDCVISLSAFKGILDNAKNLGEDLDTFEKCKEFLLKNNMIGENAEPTAIGYRIPTQSQASIPILRVVDVVDDSNGDVIMLPDGFIAITGSDFDIDKLYFAMKNINFKTVDGNVVIANDDEVLNNIKKDENATAPNILDATKTYYTNKLIDNYIKILSSNEMFGYTHTSIDSGSQSFKGNGKYKGLIKILEGAKDNDNSLYGQSFIYEIERREDNAGSQEGIGPFALSIVNHTYSQLANILFDEKASKLMNSKGLNGVKSIDHVSITDWGSYLINAHVDAVKDPYILSMNVNKYTWNATTTMIRSGWGCKTFYMLKLPIIKKLSSLYKYSNRIISNNSRSGESATKIFNAEKSKLIKELISNIASSSYIKIGNETIPGSTFVSLFKNLYMENGNVRYSANPSSSNLSESQSLLLNKLCSSINNSTNMHYDEKLGYVDDQMLGMLDHINSKEENPVLDLIEMYMFDKITQLGKSINLLTRACQVDQKKYGISMSELIDYDQNVSNVYSGCDGIKNPQDIFTKTHIGNKYFEVYNTAMKLFDILSDGSYMDTVGKYKTIKGLISKNGFVKKDFPKIVSSIIENENINKVIDAICNMRSIQEIDGYSIFNLMHNNDESNKFNILNRYNKMYSDINTARMYYIDKTNTAEAKALYNKYRDIVSVDNIYNALNYMSVRNISHFGSKVCTVGRKYIADDDDSIVNDFKTALELLYNKDKKLVTDLFIVSYYSSGVINSSRNIFKTIAPLLTPKILEDVKSDGSNDSSYVSLSQDDLYKQCCKYISEYSENSKLIPNLTDVQIDKINVALPSIYTRNKYKTVNDRGVSKTAVNSVLNIDKSLPLSFVSSSKNTSGNTFVAIQSGRTRYVYIKIAAVIDSKNSSTEGVKRSNIKDLYVKIPSISLNNYGFNIRPNIDDYDNSNLKSYSKYESDEYVKSYIDMLNNNTPESVSNFLYESTNVFLNMAKDISNKSKLSNGSFELYNGKNKINSDSAFKDILKNSIFNKQIGGGMKTVLELYSSINISDSYNSSNNSPFIEPTFCDKYFPVYMLSSNNKVYDGLDKEDLINNINDESIISSSIISVTNSNLSDDEKKSLISKLNERKEIINHSSEYKEINNNINFGTKNMNKCIDNLVNFIEDPDKSKIGNDGNFDGLADVLKNFLYGINDNRKNEVDDFINSIADTISQYTDDTFNDIISKMGVISDISSANSSLDLNLGELFDNEKFSAINSLKDFYDYIKNCK